MDNYSNKPLDRDLITRTWLSERKLVAFERLDYMSTIKKHFLNGELLFVGNNHEVCYEYNEEYNKVYIRTIENSTRERIHRYLYYKDTHAVVDSVDADVFMDNYFNSIVEIAQLNKQEIIVYNEKKDNEVI